jgi:putative endonuclease
MQLPFCVYILFSELDHQLYIGYSSDIVKRIEQHDSGQNISTKHRRPWKLIFIEYYLFKEDAKKREIYFKTTIGKRALKLMLSDTLSKLGYKLKVG